MKPDSRRPPPPEAPPPRTELTGQDRRKRIPRKDEDTPALHQSLIAMGVCRMTVECKQLVTLANGETCWVVFARDAVDWANKSIDVFVKSGRLPADEVRDPVERIGHKVI